MSDTGDRQQSRPGDQVSERWARWRIAVDLEEYFTRWHRLDQSGHSPHGEADLVASFGPSSVLDAGCGMGRVAIELRRRGIDVVGTDLDDDLLDYARRADPSIEWVCADLAALRLDRRFDVVVMAGNVMVFCRPADRSAIVANLAGHLPAGGLLVAGFDLERD
ncbi:MAG TPA: class I SAM-dependent methyltransferase, partial [Ilumatobacteraceae bacterium]